MSQLRARLHAAIESANHDIAALEHASAAPIDWPERHRLLTLRAIVGRLERTIAEVEELDSPPRGPVPIREAYSVGRR